MLGEIATDIKIAATVSGATTITGLSHLTNLIPDDIGKLGTVAGISLSLVLAYVHLRRIHIEQKKAKLDIETKEIRLEKLRTELKKVHDSPI